MFCPDPSGGTKCPLAAPSGVALRSDLLLQRHRAHRGHDTRAYSHGGPGRSSGAGLLLLPTSTVRVRVADVAIEKDSFRRSAFGFRNLSCLLIPGRRCFAANVPCAFACRVDSPNNSMGPSPPKPAAQDDKRGVQMVGGPDSHCQAAPESSESVDHEQPNQPTTHIRASFHTSRTACRALPRLAAGTVLSLACRRDHSPGGILRCCFRICVDAPGGVVGSAAQL